MTPVGLRRFAARVFTSLFLAASTQVGRATAAELPAAVSGYPIGWCIRAKPEVFVDAKAAGFEYVELALQDVLPLSDGEFAKLAEELRTLKVRALAGYNGVPKEVRLVGAEADVAKQDEHLRRLLERASALELTFLILNAGPSWRVADGESRETAMKQLAEFGRRFAAAASKHGITVLLPVVRSTDSNLITRVADAVALVQTVNHPNFKLMVDYSFLRIQTEDMNALLATRGLLRHVHIANPEKNRTYPMADDESDYAAFFGVLKQIGYRGGISVHAGTQNFGADAPRAIAFLRARAAELAVAAR